MEDAADVVAPRPAFDTELRGLQRAQVVEYIEFLEDQLMRAARDRDLAAALNADLQRLCDHTRHRLIEVTQRLNDLQSGAAALPAASQQVQNMLADADDERQKLREHATRQAQKIRSTARAQARRVVEEARRDLAAVRRHCADRIAELDIRRQQLQREHAGDLHALKEREERMHQGIHRAYQRALANAEQQANALLERARQHDAQARVDTQRLCADAQDELDAEHTRLETLWQTALSNVDNDTTHDDKDSAW